MFPSVFNSESKTCPYLWILIRIISSSFLHHPSLLLTSNLLPPYHYYSFENGRKAVLVIHRTALHSCSGISIISVINDKYIKMFWICVCVPVSRVFNVIYNDEWTYYLLRFIPFLAYRQNTSQTHSIHCLFLRLIYRILCRHRRLQFKYAYKFIVALKYWFLIVCHSSISWKQYASECTCASYQKFTRSEKQKRRAREKEGEREWGEENDESVNGSKQLMLIYHPFIDSNMLKSVYGEKLTLLNVVRLDLTASWRYSSFRRLYSIGILLGLFTFHNIRYIQWLCLYCVVIETYLYVHGKTFLNVLKFRRNARICANFELSPIENKMEWLSQSSDRNSFSDLSLLNALARCVFSRCVGFLIQSTRTILVLNDCSGTEFEQIQN